MSADVSDVAIDAIGRFREGWATGAWGRFVELLAPDFTMRVPVGELRGRVVAREEAVRHFQKLRLMRVRLAVGEPTSVTVGGRTAMVELEVSGTLYGLPYRNHLALALDVDAGGKIAAMREYFGDLDREIIARALEEPTATA